MGGRRKNIVLLGSTGSIGRQTLEVVRAHPDAFRIVALAAYSKLDVLARQAEEFGVSTVALGDVSLEGSASTASFQQALSLRRAGHARSDEEMQSLRELPCVGFGSDALLDLARIPEADVVVNALVGEAGMRASYECLACGNTLALANKESLVVAGDLIIPLADKLAAVRSGEEKRACTGLRDCLLPIDSEHGAIFQCLMGEAQSQIARLWVTASGGPFRGMAACELEKADARAALAHPTWNMGPKITIDSATLMNKGLEVIEAHHLFGLPYSRIEVAVHPQSIIHSMVEFVDGSVKAQLGPTDMRIPIQFALAYPKRLPSPLEPLDFRRLSALEFDYPDTEVFRCLALARAAGEAGGSLPCVMNAANEVAVAAFLAGECAFCDIAACVEAMMERHVGQGVMEAESIDQLDELDKEIRGAARGWIRARKGAAE